MSQFTEMHDGFFKRDFGNGNTKIWQGRLSVIAAVTPTLDRHYAVSTALGERFLQLRSHRPDSELAGEVAIDQQSKESDIQAEVRSEVSRIFNSATSEVPTITAADKRRIASMAEIVAVARTHIFRNARGSREIEFIPEPEANTRLSKALAAIAKGVASLNQRSQVFEDDIQDAFRVGLDCIPTNRLKLIVESLGKVGHSTRISRTMVDRAREELEALEVFKNDGGKLTDRFESLFKTAAIKL